MARILIIDDEPAVRAVLKFQLEKAGHVVAETTNGAEGLSTAQDAPPELIFLDAMMPKMDGWQVCRELKKDGRTKSIPVVMLTALSEKIDELRAYESGVTEFLTKPWEPKKLKELMETHLTPRKSSA